MAVQVRDAQMSLVQMAHALIEEEGTLSMMGGHPIAQVFEQWADRATGRGGEYTLTLREQDLLLARSLLAEYQERLARRVAHALAEDIRDGWRRAT